MLYGPQQAPTGEQIKIQHYNYINPQLDLNQNTAAKPSNLSSPNLDKNLTTIQYQALKIASGTTSGTSLNSLLAITGEIPLNLRREQLTLQYWATRAHPLIAQTWQHIHNLKPGRNRALINRANPPFGKRVINYIHKYKLNKVAPPKHPLHNTQPPASLPTPATDTKISTLTSKQDIPELTKILPSNIYKITTIQKYRYTQTAQKNQAPAKHILPYISKTLSKAA